MERRASCHLGKSSCPWTCTLSSSSHTSARRRSCTGEQAHGKLPFHWQSRTQAAPWVKEVAFWAVHFVLRKPKLNKANGLYGRCCNQLSESSLQLWCVHESFDASTHTSLFLACGRQPFSSALGAPSCRPEEVPGTTSYADSGQPAEYLGSSEFQIQPLTLPALV